MPCHYMFVDTSDQSVSLSVVEAEAEQFLADRGVNWSPELCSVSSLLFLMGMKAHKVSERENRAATPKDLLREPKKPDSAHHIAMEAFVQQFVLGEKYKFVFLGSTR